MNLSDEPAELLQIPADTWFEVKIDRDLALAFSRLVKVFCRLGDESKAAAELVGKLNELANT